MSFLTTDPKMSANMNTTVTVSFPFNPSLERAVVHTIGQTELESAYDRDNGLTWVIADFPASDRATRCANRIAALARRAAIVIDVHINAR